MEETGIVDPIELARDIVGNLARFGFDRTCEMRLQEGVALVLGTMGLTGTLEKEHRLTESERVDFYVSRVAIELKVKGSLSAVTRQLMRYATSPEVDCIILVTTQAKHRRMPPTLNEKPVLICYLSPLAS